MQKCSEFGSYRFKLTLFEISSLLSAVALALVLQGCATGFPNGLIYTEVTLPVSSASDFTQIKDTNKGISYCTKWFGLWASGDASIETAAKNGQAGPIKKIQRVEYHAHDILGCGRFETIVYGE